MMTEAIGHRQRIIIGQQAPHLEKTRKTRLQPVEYVMMRIDHWQVGKQDGFFEFWHGRAS